MTASEVATVLALIVVIAGLVVFMVASDSRSRNRSGLDESSRDDDGSWILGVLYNNPNDPRVLVPKRYQGGMTLNVGHPLGRLAMIGTVVLVVVLAVLGKHSSGH